MKWQITVWQLSTSFLTYVAFPYKRPFSFPVCRSCFLNHGFLISVESWLLSHRWVTQLCVCGRCDNGAKMEEPPAKKLLLHNYSAPDPEPIEEIVVEITKSPIATLIENAFHVAQFLDAYFCVAFAGVIFIGKVSEAMGDLGLAEDSIKISIRAVKQLTQAVLNAARNSCNPQQLSGVWHIEDCNGSEDYFVHQNLKVISISRCAKYSDDMRQIVLTNKSLANFLEAWLSCILPACLASPLQHRLASIVTDRLVTRDDAFYIIEQYAKSACDDEVELFIAKTVNEWLPKTFINPTAALISRHHLQFQTFWKHYNPQIRAIYLVKYFFYGLIKHRQDQ